MIAKRHPSPLAGFAPRAASRGSHASSRAGFTFTLSMVLITLTLIGAASFAQEWRKEQQASATKIVSSEALRLHGRIGSDVRAMVGAGAKVSTDNTTGATTLSFSLTQPFKREGEPIAQINEYSASLPTSLRNLGYEAVLSANNMTGSSATVIVTSKNGSLVNSNEGAYDVTTFYHPQGMMPSSIIANIYCNKRSDSVGELVVSGSAGAGSGYYYRVNYSEPGGKSYVRNYFAPGNSTATMRVTYPDDSLLYFESVFSPDSAQNRTSIHYTKSSTGALILPFDTNATGVVRDYSLFKESVTLAGGNVSPEWRSDCSHGGCYYFNGSGQYMYVPGGVALTGSEIPLPIGKELIADPWLDSFTTPADLNGGYWYSWGVDTNNGDGSVSAVSGSHAQSFISARIVNLRPGSLARIYNSPPANVSPSTAYTLSFWAKDTGSAGRYKLSNGTHCLSSLGAWTTLCDFLPVVHSPAYVQNSREFTTPPGLGYQEITASFYGSATLGTAVYYDSVSLKKTTGINGGFESYYAEGGALGPAQ